MSPRWNTQIRNDRVVSREDWGLRHEAGTLLPTGFAPKRVAIAAHFATQPVVSKSFKTLIAELVDAGSYVVVVSTAEFPGPLDWQDHPLLRTSVYRRANVGYDFGSWASALSAFPRLAAASRVILTNDSLVGPFRSIAAELAMFDQTPVDVWGLVRSRQMVPHIQSFFLGFRDGVLADSGLSRFFADVRVQDRKDDVVVAYELGLSQLMRERDLISAALHPWREHTRRDNPTMDGWRSLLDEDFPFVKRMLVANEAFEHEGRRVERKTVAQAVHDRYREDLVSWL